MFRKNVEIHLNKVITIIMLIMACICLFGGCTKKTDVDASQVSIDVEEPVVEVEVEKPQVEVEVQKPEVTVEVEKPEITVTVEKPETETDQTETVTYKFRNKKLLDQHYDKHGKEMGFASAAEYEAAASAVITNPNALFKTEKEDGDGCYFIESTNEFVVLSTDGYIRTYFIPDSGKKYFDKQ